MLLLIYLLSVLQLRDHDLILYFINDRLFQLSLDVCGLLFRSRGDLLCLGELNPELRELLLSAGLLFLALAFLLQLGLLVLTFEPHRATQRFFLGPARSLQIGLDLGQFFLEHLASAFLRGQSTRQFCFIYLSSGPAPAQL